MSHRKHRKHRKLGGRHCVIKVSLTAQSYADTWADANAEGRSPNEIKEIKEIYILHALALAFLCISFISLGLIIISSEVF